MIKPVLILLAASALLADTTFAKTVKLPSEKSPIATLTFPDDWNPEEIDNGFAGESPDGAVYIAAVAVGSDKGLKAEIDDTFAFLKEHNVELDKSSKKESKFDLNGIEATELIFRGKDEDGPTAVSITFVPVGKKLVVFTYWVTISKEKQHQPEVGRMVNSLTPTGAATASTAKASASKLKVESVIAVDKETKPASTFTPDVPELHAFFRSTGTKQGDELRGLWIAEDVGEAAPANTKIDEAKINADQADFFGAFTITKPTKGWPVGKYRVEIYAGNDLATTVKFAIAAEK